MTTVGSQILLAIMTQSKTPIAFTFYSSGCHLKGAWKIVLLSKQTNYSGVCREAESWIWTRKEESSERCNQVRCFQRNRFDIIELLSFGDPKNKSFAAGVSSVILKGLKQTMPLRYVITPWEFYTHFDRDGYLNVGEEPCFCIAFTFNLIEFCSEAKKSYLPFIRSSAIIYFVTILEDITRQEKNILKLNSKVENLTEKYRGEISDNKKKQWVSRMLWSNVFLKSHFDQQ